MTGVRERSTLVVVRDELDLAQQLSGLVVARAHEAIVARGRFDIALAGGSTPKAAYALLGVAPLADAVAWPHVRFFFGDERCVPPADDASNYKTAKMTLFDNVGIAPDAVFRMRGEDDPAEAARAYATILRAALPRDQTGTPAFDLVLLGMGPDGHTASLFPGSDPFEDDGALVRAPYVAKFETHRITLTPRVLNAARHVVVTTAGAAKADALAAVFDGPHRPQQYPISVLAPGNGDLTWLVDTAAAAKLTGR